MAYKLMVIDDAQDRRKQQYAQVLSVPEFETLYIWTRHDFERHRDTPVDGYIIDVLDSGDWASTTAAELIRDAIQAAPRPAPVFLVSQFWETRECWVFSSRLVNYRPRWFSIWPGANFCRLWGKRKQPGSEWMLCVAS